MKLPYASFQYYCLVRKLRPTCKTAVSTLLLLMLLQNDRRNRKVHEPSLQPPTLPV